MNDWWVFILNVFCRWSYLIRQRTRLWRIGLRSGDWSNPPYTPRRWTVRPPSTRWSEVNNWWRLAQTHLQSNVTLEYFLIWKQTQNGSFVYLFFYTTTIRYQSEISPPIMDPCTGTSPWRAQSTFVCSSTNMTIISNSEQTLLSFSFFFHLWNVPLKNRKNYFI